MSPFGVRATSFSPGPSSSITRRPRLPHPPVRTLPHVRRPSSSPDRPRLRVRPSIRPRNWDGGSGVRRDRSGREGREGRRVRVRRVGAVWSRRGSSDVLGTRCCGGPGCGVREVRIDVTRTTWVSKDTVPGPVGTPSGVVVDTPSPSTPGWAVGTRGTGCLLDQVRTGSSGPFTHTSLSIHVLPEGRPSTPFHFFHKSHLRTPSHSPSPHSTTPFLSY